MPTSLQQRTNPDSIQPVKTANTIARYGISYALLACLGFGVIDLAIHLTSASKLNSPEKSTIWWATTQFQKAPQKPELVLLGSSLMIAAQNDCDATYYNQSFDAIKHFRSQFLESRLGQVTGRKITTASFVIGGQMATDGFAIIDTLLQNNHAPATIVWGVAPRDFVDSTLNHPEDTETVKLMGKIAGRNNILRLSKVPFWLNVENTLNDLSALFGRRTEFRAIHQTSVERSLKAVAPNFYLDKVQAPAWLLHQVSLWLPEDNKSGQWIVRPCVKKGAEAKDNRAEYEKRYNPFKPDLFQLQLHYYEEALKQAHAGGSKVLIVNMPLTPENMRLLPQGVYELYVKNVRDLAEKNNANFLDLNNGHDFTNKDFWDPVHLNGYGAIKFMSILADTLSKPLAQ